MGTLDAILYKKGPLNRAEKEIIRSHSESAFQMLLGIPFLVPVLDIPYCHHERWDGAGYPRKLKGEEIPLAARVFAVLTFGMRFSQIVRIAKHGARNASANICERNPVNTLIPGSSYFSFHKLSRTKKGWV